MTQGPEWSIRVAGGDVEGQFGHHSSSQTAQGVATDDGTMRLAATAVASAGCPTLLAPGGLDPGRATFRGRRIFATPPRRARRLHAVKVAPGRIGPESQETLVRDTCLGRPRRDSATRHVVRGDCRLCLREHLRRLLSRDQRCVRRLLTLPELVTASDRAAAAASSGRSMIITRSNYSSGCGKGNPNVIGEADRRGA